MAFPTVWHVTGLPKEMIDIIDKDVSQFDNQVEQSQLFGDNVDTVIRNSKNFWIPSSHWLGGWLWYYIQKSNRENFMYDITDIDGGSIQYTHYGPGEHYNWHKDQDLETFYKLKSIPSINNNLGEDVMNTQGEYIRKLSFVLQISDPNDYSGGELQFYDDANSWYMAPKQRGTLVIFDSRVRHRVRKVKAGLRKSIVGWVVGPRWK